MRVVVDANVVVSGLMSSSEPPAAVLDGWRKRRFHVVLSREVAEEILEVIERPRLVVRYIDTTARLPFFHRAIKLIGVESHPPIGVVRDPKDRHVLGAALGLRADAIVSGDKDLLVLESFEGIPILSPRAFLDHMDELDASAP